MLQKPHTDTMCWLEQDLNLQFVIEKEEKKTPKTKTLLQHYVTSLSQGRKSWWAQPLF